MKWFESLHIESARPRNGRRFLVVLLGLMVCGSLGGHAGASFPGANGRIVFSGPCSFGFCIKSMLPDGTSRKNLTKNDRFNEHPEVSPDGKMIVFDADDEIFKMRIDGTKLKRLTRNDHEDDDPAWSHNGRRIVFASNRKGPADIFSMKADGTDVERLTSDGAYDAEPDVSADGLIAWKSDRADSVDGSTEIWLMRMNGSHKRNLTESAEGEGAPSWDPDADRLAYTVSNGVDQDVYRIKRDGSGEVNLTDGVDWESSYEDDPAWSPNGALIAFMSNRTGHGEIWKMPVSGDTHTRVTFADMDSYGDASWQAK